MITKNKNGITRLVTRVKGTRRGCPFIAALFQIVRSYNLIALLQKAGRRDEARALCESELAMCRAALGDAHPGTVDFVNQLAGLLMY